MVYHSLLLIPYLPVYSWFMAKPKIKNPSKAVKIISVNVFQENNRYDLLVDMVQKVNPDLLLTVETDKKWENGLKSIEKYYPYRVQVPLDNTYGMHLYSKLEVIEHKVHYFVSNNLPCIECEIKTKDNHTFTLFGVHPPPPPPSPTEEETSKERDGELMALAKQIHERNLQQVLVIGDFNNVSWSSSSKRFKRISGLKDPRIGRGLVSTFHAKYSLLRIPIDLVFHGVNIYVKTIKRLKSINSDHFPLEVNFVVSHENNMKPDQDMKPDDTQIMKEDIREGKAESGKRT